jgi:hypothetical protein
VEFRNMFRCALLIFLLGVAGLSTAEPLSFEAALDLATQSSPDIAVQTASVESARSASVAAGRLPDPKLTFGIENLPVTGEEKGSLTRDFMTMRKVGVMQDIPNSRKRDARTAAAVADAERAEAQRRVSILAVRRDTALAWLARYYLERQGAGGTFLFDVRCTCGYTRWLKPLELARRFGWDATLESLQPRMKCSKRGRKDAQVTAVAEPRPRGVPKNPR